MKYDVKKISLDDAQAFYDDYAGDKTFNQTKNYAEFRRSVGEAIFAFGIYNEDKMVGSAVVTKIKSRRGVFFHAAHGPLVLGDHKPEGFEAFLEYYKAFGQAEGADYVRLSPLVPKDYADLMAEYGFVPAAPYMVNPERTLTLNLTQSEEALLKQMSKTTRYEVRQGEKKGVEVKMGNGEADLKVFWDLHEETFARQGFTPFSLKNTKKEIEIFGKDAQIFTAWHDGKPLASSLILFDSAAGYYHQGASVRSKIPAPGATLWAAILESKKRGLKEFNFWGVSEKENKAHPWYGLSKFKRGFGGTEKEYAHAHDFGLTWKYRIARMVEKYRRKKRGY